MVDIQFLLLFENIFKTCLSKSGFIPTVDEGTQSQFLVLFWQSSKMFSGCRDSPRSRSQSLFSYKVLSYIFCGSRSVTESGVPCQKVRTRRYLQKINLTYISSKACKICCKDFYQRQTSGC